MNNWSQKSGFKRRWAVTMITLASLLLVSCGDGGSPGTEDDTGETAPDDAGGTAPAETDDEEAEPTGNAADDETIELTYSTYLPPGTALFQASEWWVREVERRSEGRVSFEIFDSGALLAAAEHMPGIAGGRVDVGQIGGAYHPGELPLTAVAGVPFVTSDAEAMARAALEMYQENDAYQEEWEAQGIKVLAMFPAGPVSSGTVDPVASVEGLDGLRMRAVGRIGEALAAKGVDVASLDAGEIYQSIETGVIDGWSGLPFDTAAGLGMPEVAPHVIQTGIGNFAIAPTAAISLEVWEGLPEDTQQVMLDVSDDFMDEAVQMVMDAEAAGCDAFVEAGGSVTVFPDDEIEAWKAEVQDDLREAWRQSAIDSGLDEATVDAFFDEYTSKIEEFEATSNYIDGMRACADR